MNKPQHAAHPINSKTLIDQCGEIFKLGEHPFRCVLRSGHKGSHRSTLNPDMKTLRDPREQEEEEVTLP